MVIKAVNSIGTCATKLHFCDMEENMNQQKQQSMKWLTDALLTLMGEKAYREISITEICTRADLSRRTFYRLYESKEDILKGYADSLCQRYFELFTKQDDLSLANVAYIFFSFWKVYKDFLLILHQQNLVHILLFKFNELLPNVYVKHKAQLLKTKDRKNIEYVAFYNAGGFWNLLIKWLEDGCAKSPEDMSAIVNEVLNLKQ
jgi:AcrR family transcriptional regulator